MALTIVGLNWMWFNSFIGLVFAGTWEQMLLRSGLDTVALWAAFWYLAARQTRPWYRSDSTISRMGRHADEDGI